MLESGKVMLESEETFSDTARDLCAVSYEYGTDRITGVPTVPITT